MIESDEELTDEQIEAEAKKLHEELLAEASRQALASLQEDDGFNG